VGLIAAEVQEGISWYCNWESNFLSVLLSPDIFAYLYFRVSGSDPEASVALCEGYSQLLKYHIYQYMR
jgi:hypothetical protein